MLQPMLVVAVWSGNADNFAVIANFVIPVFFLVAPPPPVHKLPIS
jgi:hypothetical protein